MGMRSWKFDPLGAPRNRPGACHSDLGGLRGCGSLSMPHVLLCSCYPFPSPSCVGEKGRG